MPEESPKYSDRKAFRSFDGEGSVLGRWETLLIYTSFGCGGVGGSVDRIAGCVGDCFDGRGVLAFMLASPMTG